MVTGYLLWHFWQNYSYQTFLFCSDSDWIHPSIQKANIIVTTWIPPFKIVSSVNPSKQMAPPPLLQDFVAMCEAWRSQLGEDLNILASEAHDGEFAAFISYALAFPKGFIALIDTYDVTRWDFLYKTN